MGGQYTEDDFVRDPKHTWIPVFAIFTCNCILAYFFGKFYLSNPDQFPDGKYQGGYECFSNSNSTRIPNFCMR